MKIAFVTPWYGPEIPGGMESETRRTAAHLHRAGYEVEVLTTCIRDFHADWSKNYHKPGTVVVDGITVRRFRVGSRDKHAFDQINWQLMQGLSVSAEAERVYINEMFRCPDLYQYIAGHCQEYIFLFIPYMFATTYYGAQLCPERSIIIPCLHDESYARMGIYKEVLPQARAMIIHSHAEGRLADGLFGAEDKQLRAVIGEGVDTEISFDAGRFRKKYALQEPFILYAGRRGVGKNTPLLLSYWDRYRREAGTPAKLILIGPGTGVNTSDHSDQVIDLGYVPLQDKYDAFAAASLTCQPSVNESFSLVIMESWLSETPVLVHGDCAVTREHCLRSNGGLYFTNYDEFAATLDFLFAHSELAGRMGKNGRNYVLANFTWKDIVEKYTSLISEVSGA